MHAYNEVLTILGLARFCVLCSVRVKFSVFIIKVKLTALLFCSCVHSAWKGRPRNDLYCVGQDVKPYRSLTSISPG